MSITRSSFGEVGIWITRTTPLAEFHEIALAAERLGYGTLWVAGGSGPGTFNYVRDALAATPSIRVGTSVINMWIESAETVTAEFARLEADFPGRFYLGAGPSHGPLINPLGVGVYVKPLVKNREYLDQLDAQPNPVPLERRLLGALGPLALGLAASRTLGSLPYLVPAAHTAFARAELGPDKFLAPEIGVVFDDDLDRARNTARRYLKPYFRYPNYTDTFLKFGFTAKDLEDGGSDRLVDGIFALGPVDAINARISEHLANGADHVAVQILTRDNQDVVEVIEAVAAERGLTPRTA